LQPPDFKAAAFQLRGVADELERCVNLAVVDGGQVILAAVQQLQADFAEFGGYRTRFDGLERRLAAS